MRTTTDNELPRRLNKAERHKDQERAARAELATGWSVGGRGNRAHPDGWDYHREAK